MQRSVLVIDDEKTFRMVATEALEGEGYSVVSERTGRGGIDRWRIAPTDVVILDRGLPDIDGLDVLREIRAEADARGVGTFVIVFTADADIQQAVGEEGLARVAYLIKPVQLLELTRAVASALRGGEPRAGADVG